MRLIGAGFGRTGTLSLKQAIEMIGAGPCYHMREVAVQNHAEQWHAAVWGEAEPWDEIFAGFQATVDWPACSFWRTLVEHYPGAKVLLSLRDPDRWYDSVANTIYKAMTSEPPGPVEGPMSTQAEMARRLVLEDTFGGRFEDRAHAIDVFHKHNEAVQREIPADRLLVYEVGSGWEPLCRFLDKPIPDEDFPHVNSTDEFGELLKAMSQVSGAQSQRES